MKKNTDYDEVSKLEVTKNSIELIGLRRNIQI